MLDTLASDAEHRSTLAPRGVDWFTVLGVDVMNTSRSLAIALIDQRLAHHARPAARVFFVNAHTLNMAAQDAAYRDVLNTADLVLGDGVGVRWAARLQGIRRLENLNGTDLVPDLLRATADHGHSYFLLGADAKTIGAAAAYAAQAFPGWFQAGSHHGYLTDEATTSAIIAQINAARPDLLLVGMGNPRQEQWIHRYAAQLDVAVCMGVGGLFDFWAGNVRRAPLWLRRRGMEWLWRLYQQPVLKARRYVLGNPAFLARIVRERLTTPEPRA